MQSRLKQRWSHSEFGTSFSLLLSCIAVASVSIASESELSTNAASLSADAVNRIESADAYKEIELFTEVLLQVRKHYVEEKTYKELIHGALDGMLHALDPHSDFMESKEYDSLKEDTEGHFGGVGIEIGMRGGFLTIISPIEDTPGFRAGLQSGDRIIEIDGDTTAGITMQEAVDELRGPEGTEVTISVQSIGSTEASDVTIIREEIKISTVKGARLLDAGIGYVRITQFAEPTADLLESKLHSLADEGMEGLIVDLRSNSGGLLSSAIDVSELFLGRGKLIVTTKGRDNVYDEFKRISTRRAPYPGLPIAVIVNRWSASASEIVAGALRDNRRAILVGETTYGKGSVQSIIKCRSEEGAACRLTTARYYTPNGNIIHNKGIEPDIPVYVNPAEWHNVIRRRSHLETPDIYSAEERASCEDVVDRSLQRAVDLLQALIILGG